MKVALLFFGQPRFIENTQVLNTYKNIIQRYNADVFCHVWWEDSGRYDTSTCNNMNGCDISKNAIDIIKENYKPKIITVETPRKFVMPDDAKQILDDKFTDKHTWWNHHTYGCLMSQMYSIQCVSREFEKYEAKTNKKYDWIILARFDALVKNLPSLDHPKLPKDKFYISNHHPNFPDLLFCYARRFCVWSSNVFNDMPSVCATIWEPSGEAFKSGSFYKRFTKKDMIAAHMQCDLISN
jgi:hypothetical protein